MEPEKQASIHDGSGANGCWILKLSDQQGLALIISLVALALLSLIGLFLCLNAATEIRISHNHESDARARYAALAGLEHARILLKGLDFDSLLKGPDGTFSSDPAYLTLAQQAAFRSPISWASARWMDIHNPPGLSASDSDDGILCVPGAGALPGTPLIPYSGIGLPGAGGGIGSPSVSSRYFVKASDNNGELSETSADPSDNPFADGDGLIILRSLGVAPVIREILSSGDRRNSVAMYESRVTRGRSFRKIPSPLVLVGNDVRAFAETGVWTVVGGATGPGIGVIDSAPLDSKFPHELIKSQLMGSGDITGNCASLDGNPATDCIGDISAMAASDSDLNQLANPAYLANLVFEKLARIADIRWNGGGNIVATNDKPQIVFADGDASLSSPGSGAGILVVTGTLALTGHFSWDGLILVTGSGSLEITGSGNSIRGAMLLAGLSTENGVPHFTTPSLSIRGSGNRLCFDPALVSMAIRLLPAAQTGFREITSLTDP